MEKLTKKQRHDLFIETHKLIDSGKEVFICTAYHQAGKNLGIMLPHTNWFNQISKEADTMSPQNYPKYWSCLTASDYNDDKAMTNYEERKNLRLTILEFMIEMTN